MASRGSWRWLSVGACGLALGGCISSAGLNPQGQTRDASAVANDTTFSAWPDEHWWIRCSNKRKRERRHTAMRSSGGAL